MRNPAKIDLKSLNFFPFSLSRIGLQVWAFVILLAITLMLLGFEISGRGGLWLGFLIAASLLILFFFFSTPPLLNFLKAQEIKGHDADKLMFYTQKYSRILGVAAPDVFIFPSQSVTAFAIGQGIQHSAVAVSSELLRRLRPEEVEVVIASLVGFVRSHSHFNFNLASGFSHSLIGFAQLLDSYWPTNWKSNSKMKLSPFLSLTLPLAGAVLRFAQTSQKHFDNDEIISHVLGDKMRLAQLLWKLDSYSQTLPLDILPGTNHFFLANPEGLKDSGWFLDSHPKIDQRIRRLAGHYPL